MSKLAALQLAATRSKLAKLLGFKPSALSYILFKKQNTAKYRVFEIPKRGGGTRIIKAPDEDLMLLQQKLSAVLQDCIDESDAAKKRRDNVVHGFKRKRSIITNARHHRKRRWVFNIDLKDFFPCINFGRVRGYFIGNKDFHLNECVATVLAQIACHDNALPQGSPCSPVISNLVAHVLDMHLVRLAAKLGCTYSRYADDLTFSTNMKAFPSEIAIRSEDDPHLWLPGLRLQEIIDHAGFRVNASKTRMQYRDSRQDVTGLVVNQKINVRREYRHNVRAMVHSLFSTGTFEVYGPVKKDGKITLEKRLGTLDELHGRLGFIDRIDLFNKKIAPQVKDSGRLSSKELMYRQFLIYRDFYTAKAPVILCEGETDNVYLTHAIRSLAAEFPELAHIDEKGKIRIKVRLYKYADSSTARILELYDGGTSNLSKFISAYKKETNRFKAPGLVNPVMILFDNDAGSDSIWGAIKQATRKAVKRSDPYTHIISNLYGVPTPLLGNTKESKIEDFFDAATKSIPVGGKSFVDKNKYDNTKHYGKKIFAHRVVRPQAESIDFKAFVPLLTNLTLVIKSHAAAVSGTDETQGA